jgi:hypothetical protein
MHELGGEPVEQFGMARRCARFAKIGGRCDDARAEDPRLKKVQTMLQRMLPLPSQFERVAQTALPLAELQLSS